MTREQKFAALKVLLIKEFYPYSRLLTGELEQTIGVRFKETDRAAHRNIQHRSMHIDDENWVHKVTLLWGKNNGWDIQTDGNIAICRVGYDDYINFEIEYLEEVVPSLVSDFERSVAERMRLLQCLHGLGLLAEVDYQRKVREILRYV